MTSSLYSSGHIVIANPIESSSIFLVVVLLCACMEYLFTLAGEVKSKFFQQMFETVSEEILVVGVLSLLLSFGSSIPGSIPESWCVMIQWTHVCLLFMGMFLVLSLSLMVFVTFTRSESHKKFEINKITAKSFELNDAEVRYKLAFQHFRLCCVVFGITEDLDVVYFSDYVLKTQKVQLIQLADLTWRSWLALVVMVVVNACRTRIPALVSGLGDHTNTVDIATYIALLGFLPMGALLWLNRMLRSRFDQFIERRGVTASVDRESANHLEDQLLTLDGAGVELQEHRSRFRPSDLEDPRSYLLWQTPASTMAIVQIMFLAIVWYGAVFCLNMLYITFVLPSIYLTLIFIVAAFVPVIVMIVFLPPTLFLVALLSSLGSCFNDARVRAMISVAKGDTAASLKNDGAGDGSREGPKVGAVGDKPQRIVAVKKPPPPLLIDDQALYRLASSEAEL